MDKGLKFSCCMIIDDIPVNIFSDTLLFFKLRTFIKKNFDFSTLILPTKKEEAINIFYKKSENIKLDWGKNDLSVEAPLELIKNGENLVYLASPLIEREKQKRNRVTIHAASCALKGEGILILGKEGAGKTSTIYKICKHHQAKLIGNDLTTLSSEESWINLVHGSQFFFFRKTSVEKSMPELLSLFSNDRADPWIEKIKINPEHIGIQIEKETVPLKRAFFVHVDEDQNELLISSANTLPNRLHLHENFSRYIRNSCTVLMDNNLSYWGYIPSFDNEIFFENRKCIIENLFQKYDLRYISGKSDAISSFISRDTRERSLLKDSRRNTQNNGGKGYE